VTLDPTPTTADRTRHYRDGDLLPPPSALEIVHTRDGYFLYYIGASGKLQTDTWHASLEDAFDQARYEFGLRPEQWTPADT
jgi:hypothetical protein